MDQPIASSSRQFIPPSPLHQQREDHYSRLNLETASQAQILRAHQRDSSQVYRLTELVSEVVRSIAGTRWLAHKQTIIDLLVKGVYLSLTFGRGSPTLGEEYTDISPFHLRRGNTPSRRRRFITIFLLLIPSLLASPITTNYLRNPSSYSNSNNNGAQRRTSRLDIVKQRLLRFLESPIGKALPEIHMILFLFKGKFFEFARRLTGVSYVSTLPPKPIERKSPSYEPLGLLMLLPFIYRFIPGPSHFSPSNDPERVNSDHATVHPHIPTPYKENILPLSPPLTPPLTAEQTLLLTHKDEYDIPNTYLTKEALELPERQCTLCLESRGTAEGSAGTSAVTECGHVFCWGCLGGLEKLECPLCRQTLRMERLVAAYNL
ncbi:uncharacterized protein IL334_002372 [Kwoniella shivajii]|uniref:RING-type E3 ubiquitin transferase n=1 Tax=Kwoniella shivajii TaxID=564305 RepID=A0ABZ1CVV8_9TREE|nr:hypothetical protein IL334_002372 [Kwoniella shivajii]